MGLHRDIYGALAKSWNKDPALQAIVPVLSYKFMPPQTSRPFAVMYQLEGGDAPQRSTGTTSIETMLFAFEIHTKSFDDADEAAANVMRLFDRVSEFPIDDGPKIVMIERAAPPFIAQVEGENLWVTTLQYAVRIPFELDWEGQQP